MRTDDENDSTCHRVTSLADLVCAIRVRVQVFNIEQGCPVGWEPDEDDQRAEHFVALVGNLVVGTARLMSDGEGAWKIERMAVLKEHRRRGVGTVLTAEVIRWALASGAKRLWLDAQAHAVPFYERQGFRRLSAGTHDLYNLGIPHVMMEYRMNSVAGSDPSDHQDAP
jgi:predicted GNAT family N-acyltransferase